MSILREVNRVINVSHHCHEATMSPNVTQKSSLADATSVPKVDSYLYPDLCIARDCRMILRLRSFQFSALWRGSQRPNSTYKKALLEYSWDSFYITGHRKVCRFADCYWGLRCLIINFYTLTFLKQYILITRGVQSRNQM